MKLCRRELPQRIIFGHLSVVHGSLDRLQITFATQKSFKKVAPNELLDRCMYYQPPNSLALKYDSPVCDA